MKYKKGVNPRPKIHFVTFHDESAQNQKFIAKYIYVNKGMAEKMKWIDQFTGNTCKYILSFSLCIFSMNKFIFMLIFCSVFSLPEKVSNFIPLKICIE